MVILLKTPVNGTRYMDAKGLFSVITQTCKKHTKIIDVDKNPQVLNSKSTADSR